MDATTAEVPLSPPRLAAARRGRYASRQRADNIEACRAWERRRDHRQRLQLIAFLGGACRCGLRDPRGLVVVQPAGQRLRTHQLYTFRIHEPELAAAQLRLLCATCRLIEQYERARARYRPHAPSTTPSMSSPDDHPSASDDHPSSSTLDAGAARATWGRWSELGVAFG